MLAIKLKRLGKKHQPSYRVVLGEKRSKVLGREIEDFGWYNPISKEIKLNGERINYWLGVGAQPTVTVHNLLVKHQVIKAAKMAVHKKSWVKKEEANIPPAAPSAETAV